MPVVAAAVVAILISLAWSALGWGLSVPVLLFAAVIAVTAGFTARAVLGRSEERDLPAGMVFVAVLLIAIAARYQMVRAAVAAPNLEFWNQVELADEESMISEVADEIVKEKESRGETVAWPEGMNSIDALLPEDYPSEIWAEARNRWSALSPDEQQARTKDREQRARAVVIERTAAERNSATADRGPGVWDVVASVLAAAGAALIVQRPARSAA